MAQLRAVDRAQDHRHALDIVAAVGLRAAAFPQRREHLVQAARMSARPVQSQSASTRMKS